ncbi:MAG: DMT family transporter [Bacteroidales bacterium]|nr:DMT family transporter [Bacteroidales bacterium]
MSKFLGSYLQWVLLFVLMLVWGSSFLLMKRALVFYSAIELGTLRMVFASAAMLPFALKKFRNITPRQWLFLSLFALFGNLIPAYLFAIAQTKIESSLAGILNALTPVFTLIIGLILFKIKVKWINIFGLFLGLIGAASIIYNSGNTQGEVHYGYALLVILATVFYATNINLVKFKLSDLRPVQISIYGFSLMFVPMILFLFLATDIQTSVMQPGAAAALIYPATLGLICSAGAIILFNTLIQLTSPIFASSVTYLIPIVAMIIGFFDGEHLNVFSVLWVLIIITGVRLVNKK